MRHELSWSVCVCSVVISLLIPQILRAEVTGTISGIVLDPSGAAVASATVTLRNPDTGLVRHVTTSANGTYEFLSVPVGENYSVQVQAPGFSTACSNRHQARRQPEVPRGLHPQSWRDPTRRWRSLRIAAQVDTSNTQLGDVISDKKMTTCP